MRTWLILGAVLVAMLVSGCVADSDGLGDLCPGMALCDGACADLENDPANCGACGAACGADQTCIGGVCADGCVDDCPGPGDIACASLEQNARMLCGNFDGDPCLEWGALSACADGETCMDGVCEGGCRDECPEGKRECVADGYRECGQFDDDPCLDWGAPVPCGEAQTCTSGECGDTCTDECADGERSCDGEGVRECGQFDTDPCLEWSAVEACDDDQDCEEGACVERRCLDDGDDCVCGDNACCEGHCCPFFFICVSWSPDDDWCPNGPGPNA